MNFFPFKRLKAGIEISSDALRSALVYEKGNKFTIKHLSDFTIPADILKPSFKKENILDETTFLDFFKKTCDGLKIKKLNIALPDATTRIIIRKFKELPKEVAEINDMILWSISSSLNIPHEELRISWNDMGKDNDNNHVFLIVLGLKPIISQYEKIFRKAGISPNILAPAGINQFNFYSSHIPDEQDVAFLALFNEYINIFVFENGIPVFYKSIKKGSFGEITDSAINNVDLLIQYIKSEKPDFVLDHLYIASPIKSDHQIEQIFNGLDPVDFTIIDEKGLISFDKKIRMQPDINPLPYYTSALGTALGA